MKKRYILSPVAILAVATLWNLVLHQSPQVASAEAIKPYIAPQPSDNRHPVDVYTVGLSGVSKADILNNLPTKIYPEDKVTFVVDPGLGLGTIVHVERATPLTVKDGKVTLQERTFDDTVGQLLDDINRPLLGLDKADVSANAKIESGMTITITRVKKVQRTVTLPEPYTTLTKDDPNLDKGKTRTDTAGKNGVRTEIYEDTREDGVVVKTVKLSSNVTTQPVTEVIYRGTRPVITRYCGGYNTLVLDAAIKNGLDPDTLCYRMIAESNGNPNSVAGAGYAGLFQYEAGFWASASAKAGYAGASIYDAKAQIYTTAWAWAHGYRSRWPIP